MKNHSFGIKFTGTWVRFLILGVVFTLQLWAYNSINQADEPSVQGGFLTKVRAEYVVSWRSSDSTLKTVSYSRLHDALNFIHGTLNLRPGLSLREELQTERVWEESRFGQTVVLWKTMSPKLNQMSFQNSSDAKFFADAFRRGSYSPSPIGHAVLLLPARITKAD